MGETPKASISQSGWNGIAWRSASERAMSSCCALKTNGGLPRRTQNQNHCEFEPKSASSLMPRALAVRRKFRGRSTAM